ncbi:hypothetical protein E2C01_056790 [Portunus trituberculatus]|uniref:Uncharacterized protein n=1 Tax=Portunus trituberculatus TaxID=210409 RepID=A0A5B7GRA9_PORTR|nr:hypothetical protein [Portunus trituberculatus]
MQHCSSKEEAEDNQICWVSHERTRIALSTACDNSFFTWVLLTCVAGGHHNFDVILICEMVCPHRLVRSSPKPQESSKPQVKQSDNL